MNERNPPIRPQVASIRLNETSSDFVDEKDQPLAELSGLSRVNVLVGPNNSGKSRLMRALFAKSLPEVGFEGHIPEPDRLELETLKESALQAWRKGQVRSVGNLTRKQLEQREFSREVALCNVSPFGALLPFQTKWKEDVSTGVIAGSLPSGYSRNVGAAILGPLGKPIVRMFEVIHENFEKWSSDLTLFQPEIVYIPILRGLRFPRGPNDGMLQLADIALEARNSNFQDPYRYRTTQDYQLNNRKHVKIFTGLTMYLEVAEHLLGPPEKRDLIRRYEEFLSREFFDGKSVALTPRMNRDVLYVRIDGEEERPIYELGDGLQSLIIMTFIPFISPRSLIFIEEPDMFLHPGMQRRLLEFMTQRCPAQHTYFLSTHSNHFLDMSMDFEDMSIYSVQRCPGSEGGKPTSQVRPVQTGDTHLLRELGVRSSSVFLVNATIWVEGITDRLYFRRYLQCYQDFMRAQGGEGVTSAAREFREDTHFAFVEYGGSNITHWCFEEGSSRSNADSSSSRIEVNRLCSRAMVVADGDGRETSTSTLLHEADAEPAQSAHDLAATGSSTPDKKSERILRLRETLGERFRLLPTREVENLLTPAVLIRVIKDYIGVTLPPDSFEQKDYRGRALGGFLDEMLAGSAQIEGGKKPHKFAARSGTIADKVDFCNKALNYVDYETMSPHARSFAKEMYEFIASLN